ncbi:fbc9ecfc-8ea8-4fe2-9d4d-c5690a670ded [Thermothielavioides terrestris]|jgi:hypothetical protein|uniref:Essential protein Yae1 N-terminal domain-containing protein n=2 Tax=Thermothielavioides terrestris TaxID=2587410 RepID=G2QTH0_THETT|nr:uncharacterized protein THITE_2109053 [Thermothielavioides terrestris NRRL 8126]AEO63587.1 hypothetical protein THITE_2109053 [Thermothielavioides terrestris NRRL 8126]SPQ20921.1 fbc9ecfc-8ea8-4fe2-9d4d-c5690a670ded [Thermothielavioides terrestris]
MATTAANPPPSLFKPTTTEAPATISTSTEDTTNTTAENPEADADADPFDALLTLEDQFYSQGYAEGLADGEAAGRAEGRQLGLERGFAKFVESGRLQGRAIVWANRVRLSRAQGLAQTQRQAPIFSPSSGGGASSSSSSSPGEGTAAATSAGPGGVARTEGGDSEETAEAAKAELPPLPDNARLAKHIAALYALAETESLSTENTDEAVDEFDDRLRRAQGRAKVIERMVGENGWEGRKGAARGGGDGNGNGNGNGNENGRGPGAGVE